MRKDYKQLSKAQKEEYKFESGMRLSGYQKYEKGIPSQLRVRFNLKNKAITKNRLIICPEWSGDEKFPYWPSYITTKKCDIEDLFAVIDKLFPYDYDVLDCGDYGYEWDGTTDVLTQRLPEREGEE